MIPDYTIRESARAKHVRFRVTVADGLVVVIPKGFDRSLVPKLLEGKRAWLARALQHIQHHRQAMRVADKPPMTIKLPTLDQVWRLDWIQTDKQTITLVETHPFELQICGPINNTQAWQSALRQWLVAQAREALVPWTNALSCELGIPIKRVVVRCQKTRWGSYSSKGTVSLNAQLLFVPRRLTRYVLIHELCHAVHLNHSARFWQLVERWEPEARTLRSELRKAGEHVPGWLRPAGQPSAGADRESV
ncbi:M48 family metallopeptidase [Candidatus Bipolaricaulota bacterium]|nr:M48 family metallopeptidase [Candidatus Bipolaricaulota bacterium]